MSTTSTNIEQLRLLIVGTYPPPFGGIATHLTTLIPGLEQRGAADVAVVSFAGKPGAEQRDGFVIYRYNVSDHRRKLADPRHWPFVLRASLMLREFPLKVQAIEIIKAILINDVARRHRSNVASFYQCDLNIQLPVLARIWKNRVGIVLSVFGEVYENVSRKLLTDHATFFRRFMSLPSSIVSSSRHCARSYAQIGVTRDIEPVYYGVDLEVPPPTEGVAEFRRAHGIRPDDVVVLYMARFSVEMGANLVLQTAADILARNQRIKLILAGARGDQSVAADALANAHPGRVIIRQDVPFKEQAILYNTANFLVAPSFNQRACMGMAIKEAMAASRPVIGGAGGGVSEAIVDGETGYLIPVDERGTVDANKFTDAVLGLAEDRATRERMGKAGRARAEQLFAYDRTNERMAALFTAAIPS
jgi:glycosyltransferase involved in cell wall biosynthesis